jgi:hypothetical protein
MDTLANWQEKNPTLLKGEIATVQITTQQIDSTTGNVVNVPAYLMKVGDGTTAFNALPWMSAKASDVYGWAKAATAEEVKINTTVGEKTLKAWFESIASEQATQNEAIAANTAKLAGHTDSAINTLIDNKINALDYSAVTDGAATGNKFVTKVTQTNGKIAATYARPTSADIAHGTDSDVSTVLGTLDSNISANTAKLTDVTGTVGGAITAAINGLTHTGTAASGKFVSAVTQSAGKVAVTYSSLPSASDKAAGIMKLGATGGAATYDAVSALSTQVETNKTDIASLKTSVAGGVHFIGTTSAEPTSASVTVNGKAHTATAGDVVIYDSKEYIYTGTAWEQLGDVTRLGDLETKVNNLDYTGTGFGTSKFVTKVTQTDGKIAVTYGQPASTDITHGDSTVSAELGTIASNIAGVAAKVDVAKVSTAISTAIGALDFTDPSASGNATAFIDTISQTDGKITATKKNIPTASTSAAGIVKLNDTVTSTSTKEAATANIVNTVNTKAVDAQTRVAAVEGNYIRFATAGNVTKLYAGKDGADEIIFDCGGADI